MRNALVALLLASCTLSARAGDTGNVDPAIPGIVWTYEYVLATADTDVEFAPIADRIAKDDWLPRQELTDFAAEVLLARVAQPDFPREAVISLIGILGKARTTRYGDVLTRVAETTKSMLVERAAHDANGRWIRGKGEQYVPGSIDIAALVAPVQASARSVKPTSAQGEHLAKFRGQTFAELIDWAGPPQHVSATQKNFLLGGPIGIKGNRIAFYYRGVGRVLFELDRVARDWVLHSIVADPLAFEQEFGILEGPSLEMTQLVSGYPAAMKNVVQINFRRATRSLEFLDTAAELLVTRFDSTTDPQALDMYSWICRLLTQQGGHRYDQVLARVAAGTHDNKLRDFARMTVMEGSNALPGTYVPGTISIVAQREKYPSPFPESTFTSGHL